MNKLKKIFERLSRARHIRKLDRVNPYSLYIDASNHYNIR